MAQEQYSVNILPDSLKANADKVYWKKDREIEVLALDKMKITIHEVYTIFEPDNGDDYYFITFDSQSGIKNLEAFLYDEEGQLIREIRKKDIQDQSKNDEASLFNDDRIRVVNISNKVLPYTVDIRYEMEIANTNYIPIFIPQYPNTSVVASRYIFKANKDFNISYKLFNSHIIPEIQSQGSTLWHIWTFENLPVFHLEKYGPPLDQIIPFVVIAPDIFQFGDYQGSKKTWDHFGKFMGHLNSGRDDISPELENHVQSLINDMDDENEIIRLLYQFMQHYVRYVSVQIGIGGWQTFDATYVEKNRFGDCKALSNFMKSLLQAANIESRPALIRSGEQEFGICPDIVNPLFNHVILYVPSSDLWLECTSKSFPTGYIGSSNSNKQVLVYDETGGQLISTPPISENGQKSKVRLQLSADGSAIIQDTCFYMGPAHERYRYFANIYDEKELKDSYRKEISTPSMEIVDFQYYADSLLPQFHIRQTGIVRSLAKKAGKRLFVPVSIKDLIDEIPPQISTRKYPIVQKISEHWMISVNLEFPPGFTMESSPEESIIISSEFGTYQRTISINENTAEIHSSLEMKSFTAPPDQYESFRQFYVDVAKMENESFVLVSKS